MEVARTFPERPAAKKFVLDSIVEVLCPAERLATVPIAPTVSASAMSEPPCTATPSVRSSSRISSSPTTRCGVTSTSCMPRCFTSPTLYFSSMVGLLPVELGIVPEDSLLVERKPPLGCEVLFQPRPRSEAIGQGTQARKIRLEFLHRLRKCIAQALHHLEEREMRVMERFLAFEHGVEVAHELRQAMLAEFTRPALRLALLLLVIQTAADRMVRVVDFEEPVGDGELLLVNP